MILFALSFTSPGCKPEYHNITGLEIGMIAIDEVYDYSYIPADVFDARIAFVIEKEHEYEGRKCAQNTQPFSLFDRCYATTLEQKECGSIDLDSFELYFLTGMSRGNMELGAEDNLLSVFKDRFTIKERYKRSIDPIIFFSDETLLDEITFSENTFTAVFKCRTTRGVDFEARTTVKIGSAG